MEAYRFDSLDELRVRDEPDPRPQRGRLLIKVHAVSLDFLDTLGPRLFRAFPRIAGHATDSGLSARDWRRYC